MTDQPLSEGIVHGVVEDLELPPEPPPSGPWLWVQENLIGGDTLVARVFNGILSVVFTLLALKILQFITSYIFNPERRWGAVTFNMKLLMVQAFPRADLFRIWLSVGIFFVLVAWSLVAYNLSGRISLYKVATGTRAIGVFLMLVAIMHGGAGASKLINTPVLSLDSPASYSGGRWVIFLLGLLLAVGAHLVLRSWGDAAKETTIPFLSLLVLGMAAIVAVIFTVKLPFPEGPFDEVIQPIASTTRWPWTILFALTIAAYFIGKGLVKVMGHDRFKRVLLILWVISYPIIIMVIQRKPILEWSEIAGFGSIPFFESPLGLLLAFAIIGGAVIWVLAWPKNLMVSQALAVGFGLAVAFLPWLSSEAPLPIKVLGVIAGLGVVVGGVMVRDGMELARLVGVVLGVASLMVWFIPMSFILRTLIIAFALVAIAAPSFGGTDVGRSRMTLIWVILAFTVVATFVLGEANTALQYQGTTFLGGFNLSILLAITGVVFSFPLGVVLALARTSTMPIFRLLATGYIEIVRSVPLITWLFFGSVMLALFLPGGVEFDEILRIVAAITIFSAAYVAENIRGGLQSIGKGQYEAARAMGLTTVQSTSLIILPQAIRAVLPALVGSVIVAFKDTSLVAIIGLADVLWIARTAVPSQTNPHNFLGTQAQMLFFIALFYWVFTFTFSRLSLRYEKSLGLGTR